jgi:hypothetical protein
MGIGLQVLRVHRHSADQEDGTASIVEPIGHHRTERESWLFSRQSGQAAHATQVRQRVGTLGEGGLGNRRHFSRWPRPRVLSG